MDISGIEYLGLARVLKRGSAEILSEQEDALLIRDQISGAYMLACEDEALGLSLLDRFVGQDCRLLMVSDHALGRIAFERYAFSEKIDCFQLAYFGEKPANSSDLQFRTADERDLAMLIKTYQTISPEELKQVVDRKNILLGYEQGDLVGFIGEHLEGSMGLLYVFPEHRRRGYAAALQTQMIAKTMEEGFVPFGQVEADNRASLNLQEKLGMTKSDKLIAWMWKE